MSVLINESHASPSVTFGAKSVAGNIGGTQSAALVVNTETNLNTYVSSRPGTYVINASFGWFSGATANAQLSGAIRDTSGAVSGVNIQSTATNWFFSSSCMMTITSATGVNLRQTATSNGTNSTCLGQWSVLYFPA